jgi:Flp pilus assembly protein TadD
MNTGRNVGLTLLVLAALVAANIPGQAQEALAPPIPSTPSTVSGPSEPAPAAAPVAAATALAPLADHSAMAPTVGTGPGVAVQPSLGYVPDEPHFKLEARGPNPATEPYRAALRAEATGHWELALDHARRALELDQTYAPAHLLHGRILVKMRQYEAASAILAALAHDAGTDWQAWFWLGSAQLMQGDLAAAAASSDESLRRNGKVAESWIQRAVIEQQRGDYRTSLQLLEIANDLTPEHPAVLLNIAYCSEALGNVTVAQAAYRRFLMHADRGGVDATTRVAVLRHLTELSSDSQRETSRGIAAVN